MRHDRSLSLGSALLAICTLGVAATILESASMSASYDVPTQNGGGGGFSLLEVLGMLLVALFELVGIELRPAPVVASGPPVGGLRSLLSGLSQIAVPMAVLSSIVVLVVLAGRRIPRSTTGSVVSFFRRRRNTTTASQAESDRPNWPPAEPETDVAAAWVAMTDRLEVDRPHALTPSEWADAAVAAGFDDDAVAELTHTFRAVRYGGASESPDDRRRAKRHLEQLEGDRDE